MEKKYTVIMIIVNRKRNGALLENRLNRVVVFSSFLQEAVQSYCDNRLCCPVAFVFLLLITF